MITIDGAAGEGGGQILRSALSLAMVTGQPFRIEQIRANRPKPGLLRQHLTCVRAAAALCDATVAGAEIGSRDLTFTPGPVKGGDYRFAVNSAGSAMLVLQTLLPALAAAGVAAKLDLQGGTHNPLAPPFEFIEHAFLPLVRRIGWDVSATLHQAGFYPAGGGRLTVSIGSGETPRPLVLEQRGALISGRAEALVANLPIGIAEREIAAFAQAIRWSADRLTVRTIAGDGPGNILIATLTFEQVTAVFCGFGMPGVSAEAVGSGTAAAVRSFIAQEFPVDEYLADQLLLPMVLGAGGRFVTGRPSPHFLTNMALIKRFVAAEIELVEMAGGRHAVTIAPA